MFFCINSHLNVKNCFPWASKNHIAFWHIHTTEFCLSDLSINQLTLSVTLSLFQFSRIRENDTKAQMRGDIFHNSTEIIQWLHFSHHSSGEWKDDNFITHTHTHWWHECNFFREMTSWQKYIPDKFLRCIFSCPYSGSQLTGVTWVVDRANVMWASMSVERALDLETAHEVKFYLGLSSALLLGAAYIFFDLLCSVSKMGIIPQVFLIS